MKKTLLILTLMMPGLAFGFWGKGKGKSKHKDPAKKLEMLTKKLDLTPEQKTQVAKIQEGARAKSKDLRQNKLKELRGQMKELMQSNASSEQLRAKNAEIEATQSQLRDNRFEKMLKIRALLTPEQKEKFSKMRRNFEKKFKKGRKK